MLDVFKQDAFSTVSLTDSINKAPFQPGRLGALKLFRSKGIKDKVAVVEERSGQLSLIQTTPRGGPGDTIGTPKRVARSFTVPHLEREAKIYADEVQGVRAFGSEDANLVVQTLVDERLADLRAMHEVTLEYHRAGAVQGKILDADGSTIYDLFNEFGLAQQTKDIALSVAGTDVRGDCVAIQRLIENELGAEPVSGYRALCGDAFFDALISHPTVVASFAYQEGAINRSDLRKGFEFGGITWENYRGSVAGTNFFPDTQAFVVPEGTSIFTTYYAPADFMEAVNTLGLPLYSKLISDDELNRWVKLHSQSNPLAINLRPRAVVKVTKS
jgi:hypothetical protein